MPYKYNFDNNESRVQYINFDVCGKNRNKLFSVFVSNKYTICVTTSRSIYRYRYYWIPHYKVKLQLGILILLFVKKIHKYTWQAPVCVCIYIQWDTYRYLPFHCNVPAWIIKTHISISIVKSSYLIVEKLPKEPWKSPNNDSFCNKVLRVSRKYTVSK